MDPKTIPHNEAWLWATTKIRNEVQNENIRTLLAKDWEPLPIENFPKYKDLGKHLAKMGLQDNGTVEIGSATLMRRNIDIDNDEASNRREYIAQVQRSIERNTVNLGPRYGINNIDTDGEVQRSFSRNPSLIEILYFKNIKLVIKIISSIVLSVGLFSFLYVFS